MFRNLSKVAGSAAAGVAAVSGPVSAHVDSSAAQEREASVSCPSPGPYNRDEDYDFSLQDFVNGELLSKLRGLSSQEKAEEATRQLQTNFIENAELRNPSSKTFSPDSTKGPVSEVESVRMLASNESCYAVQELTTTVTQSFSPDHMQTITAQGNNHVVAKCVDLLQCDPDVQAAVVSLARDPVMWKAFVKNEKVQELMQSCNVNLPQLEDYQQSFGMHYQQEQANPFLVAIHCVKNVVWEIMDTMVDAVNGVFGFIDRKLFGEKDCDPLDKTFKACMVFTILVLALVVMKRGPVVT